MDYAARVRVGEVFPDIWADSTQGPIQLHRWAEGQDLLLFSHAATYSDVSERDILSMVRARQAFARRGVRLLGVGQSEALGEKIWLEDLEQRLGVRVPFPILGDEDGRLSTACGIPTGVARMMLPVNRTLLIGSDMQLLAVSDTPASVPRSAGELLRVFDAVLADRARN